MGSARYGHLTLQSEVIKENTFHFLISYTNLEPITQEPNSVNTELKNIRIQRQLLEASPKVIMA